MMEVTIVLYQSAWNTDVVPGFRSCSYMEPIANMPVRPNFCFSGICSFQINGVGSPRSITSVIIPMTAVVMYIAPLLTHCAMGASRGSQLAAIGRQANKRLKKIPVYAPTMRNNVVLTAI